MLGEEKNINARIRPACWAGLSLVLAQGWMNVSISVNANLTWREADAGSGLMLFFVAFVGSFGVCCPGGRVSLISPSSEP
jgi:hypothetical protein